jgi:GT2 family glycosyltransferase
MEKTIAVVVSCNRHQALKNCIEKIRSQSHPVQQILVVNNGSSDYSTVWLDQQTDLIHLYQDNQGPAGGFHTGIDWAHRNGFTWIWCMEDDSQPHTNALEELFKHQDNTLALYNSIVVDEQDLQTLVYRTAGKSKRHELTQTILNGYAHPFNGSLIHRAIVDRVGLPNAGLFYWGEGSDYYYRITKRFGIPAKTITSSVHLHPAYTTNLKTDWKFKEGWKMYFFIRNRLAVFQAQYNNRLLAALLYALFVCYAFSSILFYQRTNRFKKCMFMFWSVKDALLGSYGQHATSVQQKLQLLSSGTMLNLFLRPIKNKLLDWLVPSHRELKREISMQ